MSAVTRIDRRQELAPTVRFPPVSIEAEQALLGAILMNGEAYHVAAALVRPEHFSEEIHRRVFDVAGGLVAAGRRITPAGLLNHLGNHDLGEGVTTQRYLARLAAEAITVVNAPEYARIVRDMATRRSVIAAAEELLDAAYAAPVDQAPEDLAAEALGSLRAVVETAPRKRTQFALGEGVGAFIERLDRLRRGEETPRSMTTGFPDLDRALSGLHPGTIVVVAARVAMGKTVAMTNLATNIARSGVGVLEIPDDEVKGRHLAQVIYDPRAPVTFSEILRGVDLTDDEVDRIVTAQREFERLAIVVEHPASITANEIAARIHVEKKRMAARGVTLGAVLIDYLDKISASDRYAGQRTYELQEIISILKSAARSEDVCIILLAQLNRGVEGREDKRPSLADLKSSSFIEQEAHAIIFVYREGYYLQKSAEYRAGDPDVMMRFEKAEHDVEMIIGKNRGGPETTVRLFGDVGCSLLSSRRWGD